jgi:hypothetical protein
MPGLPEIKESLDAIQAELQAVIPLRSQINVLQAQVGEHFQSALAQVNALIESLPPEG